MAPSPAYRIRPWAENDLEAILRVTWETWIATYTPFVPEEDLKAYFDEHYSPAAMTGLYRSAFAGGFVADVAGEVVGFVRTKYNGEENRFYVNSIYVLPAYQGKGIGRELLRAAEQAGLQYRADSIWLGVMIDNTAAVAWYRAIGFEFVREEPFTMGKTTVMHLIGYRRIQPRLLEEHLP